MNEEQPKIGRPTTPRPGQRRVDSPQKRTQQIIGIGVLVLLAVFTVLGNPLQRGGAVPPAGAASGGQSVGGIPASPPAAASAPVSARASTSNVVKYEVDASCPVSITMETPGGTSQRDEGAQWSYERSARRGDFLYLSAQVRCEFGTVRAYIHVWQGGRWVVRKEVMSSGQAVIASVSDSF
jgi:hypothetical protein